MSEPGHHPVGGGREAEQPTGVACHCITCGDVAEPMRVLRIDLDRELALCADCDDAHHTVEIALVQPVSVGDELLVHAGTAIAHVEGGDHPVGSGREAEQPTGVVREALR